MDEVDVDRVIRKAGRILAGKPHDYVLDES